MCMCAGVLLVYAAGLDLIAGWGSFVFHPPGFVLCKLINCCCRSVAVRIHQHNLDCQSLRGCQTLEEKRKDEFCLPCSMYVDEIYSFMNIY